MNIDGLGDFRSAWTGLLVEKVLGTKNDTRNTEPALHSSPSHEGPRKQVPFLLAYPLQSGDLLAGGFFHRHGTRHFRPPVDDGEAAAALSLGLASVLERRDAASSPEHLQERLSALGVNRTSLSV
jgi:hypothetical protein